MLLNATIAIIAIIGLAKLFTPQKTGEREEIFENKMANILISIYWITLPFSQCVLIAVYYQGVKFQYHRVNSLARVIFQSFSFSP